MFGRYMTAFGHAIGIQAVVTGMFAVPSLIMHLEFFTRSIDYPWHELSPGDTVCDIGSGHGTVAIELAKAYPGLKLILQDMPDVLKYAEDIFWPNEYPHALQEHRVEFKPIDFLTESPVCGCDVYFVCDYFKSRGTTLDKIA